MQKWHQEPLLHFLVIGFVLYILSYQSQSSEEKFERKEIIVNNIKVNQLISQWKRQKDREPTKEELDELIAYYIEDEILYQEALHRELQKNDPDIRSLLIDKLKFITTNTIKIDEIPEEKLKEYFLKNQKQFINNNRQTISFKQIYLNPKKHDEDIEVIADTIAAKLYQNYEDLNLSTLGDHFYAGQNFDNMNIKQLSKYFSRAFNNQLFKLPEKEWSKPIKSGFGIHIIYMEKRTNNAIIFEDVRQQVQNRWLIEENKNAYKVLYKKLKESYKVTIESENNREEN